jgi:23S rRNA (guanosine2251-2'-O)-methyltransferase
MGNKEDYFIVGKRVVFEAFKANYPIRQLIVQKRERYDELIHRIISIARDKKIEVLLRDEQWFDRRFRSLNAQGIVAVGRPFNYSNIEDLSFNKSAIFLILDRIQDPQNFGAIIRSAECAGVSGIIIQEKESPEVTESVISISSGAIFHMKIVKIKSLPNAITYLKQNGVWIVGTKPGAKTLYYDLDYRNHSFAVVLGNEGEGIRPGILDKCDFIVSIPMFGEVNSLNVSVAAGIMLFKILETKRNNGKI